MEKIILFVLLLTVVHGASFNSFNVKRTRTPLFEAPDVSDGLDAFDENFFDTAPLFEAPDVVPTGTGTDVLLDEPFLSEWDDEYSDLNNRIIHIGDRNRSGKLDTFNKKSQVATLFRESCRLCMVSGDMTCVARICSLPNLLTSTENHGVEHKAFVTGVSLHGDLLCSLCKNTKDKSCMLKFCEDPEREKHVEESGVECMQGICRWQKETVVSAGYNNYYNAWWQPNNLIVMFDQFTRDLASAYRDFYAATSRAINILG